MQINISGVLYKIEQKDLLENNTNCLGLCIYEESLFQIKKSMSHERKKQVLMHELTHAMLYESGYKDHEESLVENFSVVLNQVIQSNDDLNKILEGLED